MKYAPEYQHGSTVLTIQLLASQTLFALFILTFPFAVISAFLAYYGRFRSRRFQGVAGGWERVILALNVLWTICMIVSVIAAILAVSLRFGWLWAGNVAFVLALTLFLQWIGCRITSRTLDEVSRWARNEKR
jgi:F0F1-type ATP synthase membrane subunit a